MKKFLSISVIVGVALMQMIAVGCGGDSSSTATLTKKEFIKSASAICEQAETEQLHKATKYLQGHPGAEEVEAVIPAGLPPIEEELSKLKALGLPEGGEAEIEAFLGSLADALEKAGEDPESVLVQQGNPFGKPNKIAADYGLDACANNP